MRDRTVSCRNARNRIIKHWMFCREIGRNDPRDLARDASGTRAYSEFLVEVAGRVPDVVLPSVSMLLPHLDGEVSPVLCVTSYCPNIT